MTLLAAVLIQIGANFANDVYDFEKGSDREDRLGPQRATQSGLISPADMNKVWIQGKGPSSLLRKLQKPQFSMDHLQYLHTPPKLSNLQH